ncbi:MAG: hypothetical protein CV087_08325 [Candidatus Brocadia sp. WS118]|nr:MAG: hypothetical protein CV087_08325 [Candidatus Brocadia sp. WS118]
MFYFNIGNSRYRVRFEHTKNSDGKYTNTIAYLEKSELSSPASDFIVAGAGIAHCSLKDQFCKETGRKLALSRVLLDVFQDCGIRKLVWDAYFARKQKPTVETESVGNASLSYSG